MATGGRFRYQGQGLRAGAWREAHESLWAEELGQLGADGTVRVDDMRVDDSAGVDDNSRVVIELFRVGATVV